MAKPKGFVPPDKTKRYAVVEKPTVGENKGKITRVFGKDLHYDEATRLKEVTAATRRTKFATMVEMSALQASRANDAPPARVATKPTTNGRAAPVMLTLSGEVPVKSSFVVDGEGQVTETDPETGARVVGSSYSTDDIDRSSTAPISFNAILSERDGEFVYEINGLVTPKISALTAEHAFVVLQEFVRDVATAGKTTYSVSSSGVVAPIIFGNRAAIASFLKAPESAKQVLGEVLAMKSRRDDGHVPKRTMVSSLDVNGNPTIVEGDDYFCESDCPACAKEAAVLSELDADIDELASEKFDVSDEA